MVVKWFLRDLTTWKKKLSENYIWWLNFHCAERERERLGIVVAALNGQWTPSIITQSSKWKLTITLNTTLTIFIYIFFFLVNTVAACSSRNFQWLVVILVIICVICILSSWTFSAPVSILDWVWNFHSRSVVITSNSYPKVQMLPSALIKFYGGRSSPMKSRRRRNNNGWRRRRRRRHHVADGGQGLHTISYFD